MINAKNSEHQPARQYGLISVMDRFFEPHIAFIIATQSCESLDRRGACTDAVCIIGRCNGIVVWQASRFIFVCCVGI